MRKKGFTLVELLGVIIILIIVLGIAVVGYIKVQEGIKNTYYHGQEDSIMLAATEYYHYNEDKTPKMFGEAERISLQELINNGFIDNIIDRNKNSCDLEQSSVIAYRNSFEKIKYEICLVCPNDNYKTEAQCESKTIEDYGLQVTATIGNTTRKYKEGTWSNQDVWLTFKTGNDVNTVKVNGITVSEKSCTLNKVNGIKTCKIKIDTTDTYTIVGHGANGNTTESKTMRIQIDKSSPTFDIDQPGNITRVYSGDNITITNIVKNISDGTNSSNIDGIIYSFEKVGDPEKYITGTINNNSITITKALTNAKWKLKIELRDIAGNKTIKEVIYNIYKMVPRPTASGYCDNKIYNGKTQGYTKTPLTGVKFENISGINAGDYTVDSYPKINEYYVWDDSTDSNLKSEKATFVCNIAKKDTPINWGTTTSFTYNGGNQAPTAGATGVSGETINITRTQAIDQGTYTSTASCSSVTGGQGLCANYNFTGITKSFTINRKSIAVSWGSTTTFTYNGGSQAPSVSISTGVSGETMNLTRTTEKNQGTYTSTASCSSVTGGRAKCDNYTLTSTTKGYTINKKDITISWGETTFTYNGSAQGPTASAASGVSGETINISRTTATNQGTYTSTASCSSVTGGQGLCTNYNFKETTKKFTINKKDITISWGGTSFTYNGSAQGPTASATSGVSGETINISRTTATDQGNHTSTASCTSVTGGQGLCTNYNFKETTKSFTIARKSVAVSWGTTTSFTYNGGNQAPTASATSGVSGETIYISRTQQTNVGSYTSTASCSSVSGGRGKCDNYTLTGTTKGYSITRASVGNPPGSPGAKTFNGGNYASGITCPSGTSASGETSAYDAGTHYHKCKPDGNHQWANGEVTEKSISWVINAKSVSVSWSGATSYDYDGAAHAPTASASSGVSGETINMTRTTASAVGNHTSTASCSSVSGGRGKCGNYSFTNTTKSFSIIDPIKYYTMSLSGGSSSLSGCAAVSSSSVTSATASSGSASCWKDGGNICCSVTGVTTTTAASSANCGTILSYNGINESDWFYGASYGTTGQSDYNVSYGNKCYYRAGGGPGGNSSEHAKWSCAKNPNTPITNWYLEQDDPLNVLGWKGHNHCPSGAISRYTMTVDNKTEPTYCKSWIEGCLTLGYDAGANLCKCYAPISYSSQDAYYSVSISIAYRS